MYILEWGTSALNWHLNSNCQWKESIWLVEWEAKKRQIHPIKGFSAFWIYRLVLANLLLWASWDPDYRHWPCLTWEVQFSTNFGTASNLQDLHKEGHVLMCLSDSHAGLPASVLSPWQPPSSLYHSEPLSPFLFLIFFCSFFLCLFPFLSSHFLHSSFTSISPLSFHAFSVYKAMASLSDSCFFSFFFHHHKPSQVQLC